MAQQQANVNQTQQATQQSVGQTTQQSAEGEQDATPIWKKWWLWLIVAFVIIGAGIEIYFLFFK